MGTSEGLEKKKKKKSKKAQDVLNIEPTTSIGLEDNYDILVEVLKHLDARSLGTAACVSKLWNTICTMESMWENLCNRHCTTTTTDATSASISHVRSVVLAMGGYRRLYLLCIRPLLARLASPSGLGESAGSEPCWTRDQVQLSVSLFSIDCYERLGNKLGDCSSLLFLYNTDCKSGITGSLVRTQDRSAA